MNYYIQDICCFCLSISNEKFSKESLIPLDEIKMIFLELSAVIDSDNRICRKCSEIVDYIFNFRKTCLKNIKIFNSYKNVLLENQSKNQCDLFVNLNKSNQIKDYTLTSKKIKIEPPESYLNNDDSLSDTEFVLDGHSNRAAEVKNEFEMNYKTCEGNAEPIWMGSQIKTEIEETDMEEETSWLDPEVQIKVEENGIEKVWINDMSQASVKVFINKMGEASGSNNEEGKMEMKHKKFRAYCSINGCHSCYGKEPVITLHQAPKPGTNNVTITSLTGESLVMDRRKAWEYIMGQKITTKNFRVCSLHFKRDDFILPDVPAVKKHLKRTAVPSLNLSNRREDLFWHKKKLPPVAGGIYDEHPYCFLLDPAKNNTQE